jgi:NAD(P)-dependent dehydrogenase (short-subunit alcohol dehydrogenase family)
MTAMNGKVVVVTGGSSGIGRAAALSFARQGASVIITGRRAAPLDEAAAEPADAVRTVATAVEMWGHLDVLVNNAGAGAILPVAETTADRIRDIFAVNVLGPSLLTVAALPSLTATKGTIVNVSSTFGHKPVAGLSHYATSMASTVALTLPVH